MNATGGVNYLMAYTLPPVSRLLLACPATACPSVTSVPPFQTHTAFEQLCGLDAVLSLLASLLPAHLGRLSAPIHTVLHVRCLYPPYRAFPGRAWLAVWLDSWVRRRRVASIIPALPSSTLAPAVRGRMTTPVTSSGAGSALKEISPSSANGSLSGKVPRSTSSN